MPSYAAKMIKQYGDLQICWLRSFFYTLLLLGQIFPFVFVLSLVILNFFFALWYFVNYASLLRAVCKFSYSLLSRPFLWT